ncbi:MAG: hypothetical protein QM765_23760 [Myxococcales bacterium]
MRTVLAVLFAVSVSVSAFAAEPAPAGDDCDACKANAAVMKAGKVQATKLNNGTLVTVTAQGKKLDELKKAVGEMDAAMKSAMEGKAKLDPACTKMIEAVKGGKVMMGKGELKDGFAMATLSPDPEIVKALHEQMDKMGKAKK